MTPTPRGGGISIVLTVLLSLIIAMVTGLVKANVASAFVGGILIVGGVGMRDDLKGVRPLVRFAAHILAASWAIALIGVPTLPVVSELGSGGQAISGIICVIVIAWSINLYNFMDGIDGLAASEAATVGIASGILFLAQGDWSLAWLGFSLAAAAAGFIPWNWAPARIFMGDVGSGTIGFIFGTLAVAAERSGTVPLIGVLLLLGVFITDATITVLLRMLRGERWYEAHRTHAYQLLVQAGWSHRRVTCCVILLGIVLAFMTYWGLAQGELGFVSAAALVGLCALYVAAVRTYSRSLKTAAGLT